MSTWSDPGDNDEPENYGYDPEGGYQIKGKGRSYIIGKSGEMIKQQKTTICRSWANGTCDRGIACGFAHGASELRRIEHDSGNFSGPPGCVDYMKGTCGKGEMCSFNHNRNVIQNRFAEE